MCKVPKIPKVTFVIPKVTFEMGNGTFSKDTKGSILKISKVNLKNSKISICFVGGCATVNPFGAPNPSLY